MNWNTYVFKTCITLTKGNSYWDPQLQKEISTPDWKMVEEDHIDVVVAPDIYSAEELAHIRTLEYGVQNGWDGVCIWRVIADKIETEDDIDAFLDKWANH